MSSLVSICRHVVVVPYLLVPPAQYPAHIRLIVLLHVPLLNCTLLPLGCHLWSGLVWSVVLISYLILPMVFPHPNTLICPSLKQRCDHMTSPPKRAQWLPLTPVYPAFQTPLYLTHPRTPLLILYCGPELSFSNLMN